MTLEQKIKQLVEQIYKLDITNNCRESRFVQARLIYYKLCIQYCQEHWAQSRHIDTRIKAMGCLYQIF
jgi:hypothetical protein